MRILVVDDDASIRRVAEFALKKAGHEVACAAGGEEALAQAGAALPDLVLLDVSMPGVDGYEACRRLKAGEGTKGVPVIFLSASIEPDERRKGLELGALGYLAKPFNPLTLAAQIAALKP